MSWHDDLTETYFPSQPPPRVGREDIPARIMSGAAILLTVAAFLYDYSQRLDDVERARATCVREQRDAQVELRAWEELEAFVGPGVNPQIKRLSSVVRRDCNKQHPDPGLFD